jgi:nucleotide-binding universal stress UspA family protein
MYKKILVPLDGSERAESILAHVRALARDVADPETRTREVVLLQVFELPHITSLSRGAGEEFASLLPLEPAELQERVAAARAYLAGQTAALTSSGLYARYRVAFGPVAATILQVAEEENADLVAMASHGRSGMPGVYYGSVAAAILQRIDRPLLIVRTDSVED